MATVETTDGASSGAATRTGMEKVDTSSRDAIEKMVLHLHADIRNMHAEIRAEFRRLYWYIPLVMGVPILILEI